MPSFSPVTHVIFDMDGLLLDTETLYMKAYQMVIDQFNKTYTFEMQTKLLGCRPMDCADQLIREYDLPLTPAEWQTQLEDAQRHIFPGAEWMPGMAKLVHHLYKHKIPMAIATSSGDVAFDLKTKPHAQMFAIFNHVVKGSDPEVINGKPAPDIFKVCADRFEGCVSEEKCLAFEDSPNGVKASIAAGMQTVMIPDPRLPKELTLEATKVLSSGHEFDPREFGLPGYQYKPVTHVIFDMDGLLLDTSRTVGRLLRGLLEKEGKQIDRKFQFEIMGRRFVENIPKIVEHYKLPYTSEEFSQIYLKTMKDKAPDPKLLRGVDRLISHFISKGVPIAVATSSSKGSFQRKCRTHKAFFSRFSHIVTGSDPELKHGKPRPDIFQIAARRFADPPAYSSCLVFEDAPSGVEAARAAGMQCVMIPDINLPLKHQLKATQRLNNMEEFRPSDFGLPEF